MPGKGFEKRGGVPPSHKAMAGQVEEGKKDLSLKGLFPLLNSRPLFITKQIKNQKSSGCACKYGALGVLYTK